MDSKSSVKRTLRLKDELLSSKYELCIERARSFTEVYRRLESSPQIIKKAEAIVQTLRDMSIFIRKDEMLVGNETSKNLGEKMPLDLYSFQAFINPEKLRKLAKRPLQPFYIDEEDILELQSILPYWK